MERKHLCLSDSNAVQEGEPKMQRKIYILQNICIHVDKLFYLLSCLHLKRSSEISVCCATHRFAGGLLQKLHCFLPFVLLVLLTHLQRGSLLLVFYVLLLGKSGSIFNDGYCLPPAL